MLFEASPWFDGCLKTAPIQLTVSGDGMKIILKMTITLERR